MSLARGSILVLVPALLLALAWPRALSAQDDPSRFARLSIEQGLSQSTVPCILQDRKGFLWFGTADGLNRYDGYSFRVYKNDPQDPASISNNDINTLYEDGSGTLWIGTNDGGLCSYDPRTDRFTTYRYDPQNPASLSNNNVRSILEDRAGALWVATRGGGLCRLDRATGRFTRFLQDPNDPRSISSNFVNTLCEDRSGTLWAGMRGSGLCRFDGETGGFTTYHANPKDPEGFGADVINTIVLDREGMLWLGTYEGGLSRFDPATGRSTTYRHDPLRPDSLSSNTIRSILEDRSGALWIGTSGGGLCLLDRSSGHFTIYRSDPRSGRGLGGSSVLCLFEDRAGSLWIGTNGGGICRFNRDADRFTLYRGDPAEPGSLSSNYIRALLCDRAGTLWVGTLGGGLWSYNRTTGRSTTYTVDPKNPSSLASNDVYALCEDRDGTLWIGLGSGGGLCSLDRATGHVTRYQSDAGDPSSLSGNDLRAICEDREGTLWIGTFSTGLCAFDRASKKFTRYASTPDDPAGLTSNDIWSVYEDREGALWVGTGGGGLCRFDRPTGRFVNYKSDPHDPSSLSSNSVWSIYEDREGTLWIGTINGGLNRFDRASGAFQAFRERDGLANDTVYGILEDSRGDLWLSTNGGLSRFTPHTSTFRTYDVGDGLQSSEFNFGAYCKSASGEMFFGGIAGFNSFVPEQIQDNPYVPPVVITEFKKFNKPVKLDTAMPETAEIEIEHTDDFISFEFASLNYINPQKNRYAYKLEGFDHDWIQAGTQRIATYTNLDGGEYVFRVKGSNNDGVWNEEGASVRIRVIPPLWKTRWAYLLYALAIAGLVYGGTHLRVRALRRRTARLEGLVAQRTASLAESERRALDAERQANEEKRRAVEANDAKSLFLSKMSHELRTPLNAVLGYAQRMERSPSRDTEDRRHLDIIRRSGEHLLDLINDVLSISKIEAGKLALNEEVFDPASLLRSIDGIIRMRAEEQGLRFEVEAAPEFPTFVRGDPSKLRQVLINLLGNACKFTNAGRVVLRARWAGGRAEFEVEDTGHGIRGDEIETLFTAFVQTGSGRGYSEGTGLGLAISRSFVELMGGQIRVRSRVGEGTVFSFDVALPAAAEESHRQEERAVTGLAPGQEARRVLVVDDLAENRMLLAELLARAGFEVEQAADGTQAVGLWRQWHPHLIWMDMRMPVMDGYEATRTIREAEGRGRGSGIGEENAGIAFPTSDPCKIVAITASAFDHEREAILAAGCDDLVTKPFVEAAVFEAMAKHLGAEFVYSEAATATHPLDGDGALSVERLAALAPEQLAALLGALREGDFVAANRVAESIRERDARLGEELLKRIGSFRLEPLLDLVERVQT